MSLIKYSDAVDYINSVIGKGCKYNLHNVKTILKILDNPHKKIPFIHIAGTNGKGSVACLMESILNEAGYKTGMTTSPHLLTVRDRIRYNGEFISEEEFAQGISRIKAAVEKTDCSPTYFELLVLLSLNEFYLRNVDIGIVEVGVGGRLDSTNVIHSEVSVITEIGYDHINYLGPTLSDIAGEKAAIVKDGSDVVIGVRDSRISDHIREIAESAGGRDIFQLCRELKENDIYRINVDSMHVSFENSLFGIIETDMKMVGEHQFRNCICAVETAAKLVKRGYRISRKNIIDGISKSLWQGRFHFLRKDPDLIIDGAHNESATIVLADTIRKIYRDKKVNIVFSIFREKGYEKIIKILKPVAEKIYLTKAPSPRVVDSLELEKYCSKLNIETEIIDKPEKAVNKAIRDNNGRSGVIVSGSLYLVGEVYNLFIDGKILK